jgi:23S rRNA pseudouridine1911/1915/1917 synthase
VKIFRATTDRRDNGTRLDLFLIKAVSDLSRKRAKRLIDEHRVSVNGKIEAMASRLLKEGERVEVRFPEESAASGKAKAEAPKVGILYRDAHFVAVDKGPGLPSGPTRDPGRRHAQTAAEETTGQRLTLLHRIDRDTTGILLLARTKAFAEELLDAFKTRRVEKTYLAIVSGRTPESFEDVCHLKEVAGGRVAVVQSGGMRAETAFRTLAVSHLPGEGHSLVEAHPHTGRMHQIRAQLSRRGYPILGDSLYGGSPAVRVKAGELAVPRQMLHARRIAFVHPATGQRMEIESPIPEDFYKIMEALFGAVEGA